MAAGDNKYGVPSYSDEYRKKYNEENREHIRKYHREYARKKRLLAALERGVRRTPGRPLRALEEENDELEQRVSELPIEAFSMKKSKPKSHTNGRIDDGSPVGRSPLVDEATGYSEFARQKAEAEGTTPEEVERKARELAELMTGFKPKPEEQ
jgi:hypothetical protein